MDIYREKLLDHYQNPRNYGELDMDGKAEIELENASCGDLIKIQLKIENGVIKAAKFQGEGCAVAISSASILTEYMHDKKIEEILQLSLEDFIKVLGVEITISRFKCANLALEASKDAINLQLTNNGQK
jgi:nitrogen fixation protein NifU and related proteins